ncbi:DUF5134 domain-containing protein [Streptomyces sp. NPDC058239]|uniref:DUF5134 domain-containing protein n=1 Tax=unclassified Streptomyces TaxID=2593676 RepID=UPI00364CBB78
MSATDIVYGMLTTLFVAAAVHGLRHAVLSAGSGWRSRVDHLLHAAMATVMAAMPWGKALPEAGLTLFFAAATVWFPLTAVRHREKPAVAEAARRLAYAVGMSAMVWRPHSTAGPSHSNQSGGTATAHQAAPCPSHLQARRSRASHEGWLGEVEGLDLTLTFLQQKREQTQRLTRFEPVNLGMPGVRPGGPS